MFCTDSLNIDGRLEREKNKFGVELIAADKVEQDLKKFNFKHLQEFDYISINLDINESNKDKSAKPSKWERNNKWRISPSKKHKEYIAFAHINIRPWARTKKIPRENWLPLDSMVDEYEKIARLVVAQIALEVGDNEKSIEQLIRGTGVSIKELLKKESKKSYKTNSGQNYKIPLDVYVYHGFVNGRNNSKLRNEINCALTESLVEAGLGKYDGGSSSDEHFEFGFLVSDVEKAKNCIDKTLTSLGIERRNISYE